MSTKDADEFMQETTAKMNELKGVTTMARKRMRLMMFALGLLVGLIVCMCFIAFGVLFSCYYAAEPARNVIIKPDSGTYGPRKCRNYENLRVAPSSLQLGATQVCSPQTGNEMWDDAVRGWCHLCPYVDVILKSDDPGDVRIYYTIDSTEPCVGGVMWSSDPGVAQFGRLRVYTNTVMKSVAVLEDGSPSDVSTKEYRIKAPPPEIKPYEHTSHEANDFPGLCKPDQGAQCDDVVNPAITEFLEPNVDQQCSAASCDQIKRCTFHCYHFVAGGDTSNALSPFHMEYITYGFVSLKMSVPRTSGFLGAQEIWYKTVASNSPSRGRPPVPNKAPDEALRYYDCDCEDWSEPCRENAMQMDPPQCRPVIRYSATVVAQTVVPSLSETNTLNYEEPLMDPSDAQEVQLQILRVDAPRVGPENRKAPCKFLDGNMELQDGSPLTIIAGVASTMVTIQAITPESDIFFTYNQNQGEELPYCNPNAGIAGLLDASTCGPYEQAEWTAAAALDSGTCPSGSSDPKCNSDYVYGTGFGETYEQMSLSGQRNCANDKYVTVEGAGGVDNWRDANTDTRHICDGSGNRNLQMDATGRKTCTFDLLEYGTGTLRVRGYKGCSRPSSEVCHKYQLKIATPTFCWSGTYNTMTKSCPTALSASEFCDDWCDGECNPKPSAGEPEMDISGHLVMASTPTAGTSIFVKPHCYESGDKKNLAEDQWYWNDMARNNQADVSCPDVSGNTYPVATPQTVGASVPPSYTYSAGCWSGGFRIRVSCKIEAEALRPSQITDPNSQLPFFGFEASPTRSKVLRVTLHSPYFTPGSGTYTDTPSGLKVFILNGHNPESRVYFSTKTSLESMGSDALVRTPPREPSADLTPPTGGTCADPTTVSGFCDNGEDSCMFQPATETTLYSDTDLDGAVGGAEAISPVDFALAKSLFVDVLPFSTLGVRCSDDMGALLAAQSMTCDSLMNGALDCNSDLSESWPESGTSIQDTIGLSCTTIQPVISHLCPKTCSKCDSLVFRVSNDDGRYTGGAATSDKFEAYVAAGFAYDACADFGGNAAKQQRFGPLVQTGGDSNPDYQCIRATIRSGEITPSTSQIQSAFAAADVTSAPQVNSGLNLGGVANALQRIEVNLLVDENQNDVDLQALMILKDTDRSGFIEAAEFEQIVLQLLQTDSCPAVQTPFDCSTPSQSNTALRYGQGTRCDPDSCVTRHGNSALSRADCGAPASTGTVCLPDDFDGEGICDSPVVRFRYSDNFGTPCSVPPTFVGSDDYACGNTVFPSTCPGVGPFNIRQNTFFRAKSYLELNQNSAETQALYHVRPAEVAFITPTGKPLMPDGTGYECHAVNTLDVTLTSLSQLDCGSESSCQTCKVHIYYTVDEAFGEVLKQAQNGGTASGDGRGAAVSRMEYNHLQHSTDTGASPYKFEYARVQEDGSLCIGDPGCEPACCHAASEDTIEHTWTPQGGSPQTAVIKRYTDATTFAGSSFPLYFNRHIYAFAAVRDSPVSLVTDLSCYVQVGPVTFDTLRKPDDGIDHWFTETSLNLQVATQSPTTCPSHNSGTDALGCPVAALTQPDIFFSVNTQNTPRVASDPQCADDVIGRWIVPDSWDYIAETETCHRIPPTFGDRNEDDPTDRTTGDRNELDPTSTQDFSLGVRERPTASSCKFGSASAVCMRDAPYLAHTAEMCSSTAACETTLGVPGTTYKFTRSGGQYGYAEIPLGACRGTDFFDAGQQTLPSGAITTVPCMLKDFCPDSVCPPDAAAYTDLTVYTSLSQGFSDATLGALPGSNGYAADIPYDRYQCNSWEYSSGTYSHSNFATPTVQGRACPYGAKGCDTSACPFFKAGGHKLSQYTWVTAKAQLQGMLDSEITDAQFKIRVEPVQFLCKSLNPTDSDSHSLGFHECGTTIASATQNTVNGGASCAYDDAASIILMSPTPGATVHYVPVYTQEERAALTACRADGNFPYSCLEDNAIISARVVTYWTPGHAGDVLSRATAPEIRIDQNTHIYAFATKPLTMASTVSDKYMAIRAAAPEITYPQIGNLDLRPINLQIGGSNGRLRENVFAVIGDRQQGSAQVSVCDKTPNTTIFMTRFFEQTTAKLDMSWVADKHCLLVDGGGGAGSCSTDLSLSGDKEPLGLARGTDGKNFDLVMFAASRDQNDLIVAGDGTARIFQSPWTVMPMLFVEIFNGEDAPDTMPAINIRGFATSVATATNHPLLSAEAVLWEAQTGVCALGGMCVEPLSGSNDVIYGTPSNPSQVKFDFPAPVAMMFVTISFKKMSADPAAAPGAPNPGDTSVQMLFGCNGAACDRSLPLTGGGTSPWVDSLSPFCYILQGDQVIPNADCSVDLSAEYSGLYDLPGKLAQCEYTTYPPVCKSSIFVAKEDYATMTQDSLPFLLADQVVMSWGDGAGKTLNIMGVEYRGFVPGDTSSYVNADPTTPSVPAASGTEAPVDFVSWLKFLRQPATDFCFYDYDYDCQSGFLTQSASSSDAAAVSAIADGALSGTPAGTCVNPGFDPSSDGCDAACVTANVLVDDAVVDARNPIVVTTGIVTPAVTNAVATGTATPAVGSPESPAFAIVLGTAPTVPVAVGMTVTGTGIAGGTVTVTAVSSDGRTITVDQDQILDINTALTFQTAGSVSLVLGTAPTVPVTVGMIVAGTGIVSAPTVTAVSSNGLTITVNVVQNLDDNTELTFQTAPLSAACATDAACLAAGTCASDSAISATDCESQAQLSGSNNEQCSNEMTSLAALASVPDGSAAPTGMGFQGMSFSSDSREWDPASTSYKASWQVTYRAQRRMRGNLEVTAGLFATDGQILGPTGKLSLSAADPAPFCSLCSASSLLPASPTAAFTAAMDGQDAPVQSCLDDWLAPTARCAKVPEFASYRAYFSCDDPVRQCADAYKTALESCAQTGDSIFNAENKPAMCRRALSATDALPAGVPACPSEFGPGMGAFTSMECIIGGFHYKAAADQDACECTNQVAAATDAGCITSAQLARTFVYTAEQLGASRTSTESALERDTHMSGLDFGLTLPQVDTDAGTGLTDECKRLWGAFVSPSSGSATWTADGKAQDESCVSVFQKWGLFTQKQSLLHGIFSQRAGVATDLVSKSQRNCAGAWSSCTSSCTKTYGVTAFGGALGAKCEAEDGEVQTCNAGEGSCPASCRDLIDASSAIMAAIGGTSQTAYETTRCADVLEHTGTCVYTCANGNTGTVTCDDGAATADIVC